MRKNALFAVLLSLILLAGASFPVLAGTAYSYTVRIFAGAQGTFADGSDVIVYENLHYGDRISFSLSEVVLKEGSKYYVKGIREAGKDNSEIGPTSFPVTRDQDFVVAYGVLSNAVAYRVDFVDEAGSKLAESETYYGNVGDRPVAAFRYLEGYLPQAFNQTKTLTKNAAENVFTFIYKKVAVSAVPAPQASAQTTAAPPAESTAADSGETTAAGTAETTAETSSAAETQTDAETPASAAAAPEEPQAGEGLAEPFTPIELLDLDAPALSPVASDTIKAGALNPWLISGIGAILLAGGTAFLLTKKKKQK